MKHTNFLVAAFILISSLCSAQTSVPRVPLYEVFTSSTCPPCRGANEHMTPLFKSSEGEVAVIKYQMSWPSTGDPYFTEAGSMRRNQYGIGFVPQLMSNGEVQDPLQLSQGEIESDLDELVGMVIDVRYLLNPDSQSISIKAKIEALDDFAGGAHRINIAVVERENTMNRKSNGETEFQDVLKIMLPSSSGEFIVGEISAGDVFEYDITHVFQGDYRLPINAGDNIDDDIEHSVENFDSLHVVVFMQSAFSTTEVYQAGIGALQKDMLDLQRPWGDPALSIEELDNVEFVVYPNPAHGGKIRVSHGGELKNISVRSLSGAEISLSHSLLYKHADIDVSSLANGIYIISAESDTKVFSEKLIVH